MKNPQRPHDVPDYRLWLQEMWRGPFAAMGEITERHVVRRHE